MQAKIPSKEFTTRSIEMAAILTCLDHKIVRIEAETIRLRAFIFQRTQKLADDLELYWDKKLLMEPSKLIEKYEDIKRQIRERDPS